MRLIDADVLKDSFCEACSTKKRYKRTDAECRTHSNALYGYSCFKMRLIDAAPTIDAEPVVCCKDCVYYRPEPYGNVMMCYEFANGYWPHPDDYCSRGKRKEVEAQDEQDV